MAEKSKNLICEVAEAEIFCWQCTTNTHNPKTSLIDPEKTHKQMLSHKLLLSRLTQIISLHLWNSFAWKTLAYRVSSLVEVSRRVAAGMRTTPLSSFLPSLCLSTPSLALSSLLHSSLHVCSLCFNYHSLSHLLHSTNLHHLVFFSTLILFTRLSFTFTLPIALTLPSTPLDLQ